MPEFVDENPPQYEVIGRFRTTDGEDAEVVKLSKDADAVSDDMVRPFAEILTETDLKDSVFTIGQDIEELREHVISKKIRQIKDMIVRGEALLVKIGERIVAVQGLVEKTKMPNGRPLLELTKGATLGEYREKDFAKILAAYSIQSALKSGKDAIFISYSRNQLVIDAFTKKGWHVVDTEAPHPIARAYNKDTDAATMQNLIKDGYKVIYFDPKNEIQPDDRMEVQSTTDDIGSQIRNLLPPN